MRLGKRFRWRDRQEAVWSAATEHWPVLLWLLAVLGPAACLFWFMGVAMRNERFAVRQKLADAYQIQLSAAQGALRLRWKETCAELELLAARNAAPAAFARCVRSGLADSVLIIDDEGRLQYPNAPSAPPLDTEEGEAGWQSARDLESRRAWLPAAQKYADLAGSTNARIAARALQAQARCLRQAGKSEEAVKLVFQAFGDARFRLVTDAQGRLIAANAELMALDLLTNRSSTLFREMSDRLATRLNDYENATLAAPQRRFLMKELQRLRPGPNLFPTLPAEDLAAEGVSRQVSLIGGNVLQRSALSGRWQCLTPNGRMLAFFRTDQLLARSASALGSAGSPDADLTLVPPDAEAVDALATLPAGDEMPGWRLAASLKDRDFFQRATTRQTAIYWWSGLLVVGSMGVLMWITFRWLRRQVTLARLKNDLAATVSHELKTPLSAMRVLVETLLDAEKFDEQRTREYLRLIARENERLGRLIQNFLAFTRLERRRYAFQLSPQSPREVIETALQSVRERLESAGCSLEVRIDENLPDVVADPEALGVALTNLIENACKYSDDEKHIVVAACVKDGQVSFSVKDRGIGIAARERKRIFQPFYQVDQRLSRRGGGCGLGLSIVQFIALAHRGTVKVESQPGAGSTFTLALPVASPTDHSRAEVMT